MNIVLHNLSTRLSRHDSYHGSPPTDKLKIYVLSRRLHRDLKCRRLHCDLKCRRLHRDLKCRGLHRDLKCRRLHRDLKYNTTIVIWNVAK